MSISNKPVISTFKPTLSMSEREQMDLLKSEADLAERSAQDFVNSVNEFFSYLPKKKDLVETYPILEEVSPDKKIKDIFPECKPGKMLEWTAQLQDELDAKKEALEKEIRLLEKEKLHLELGSGSKLSKMQEELKEQELLLKCYKTLLPVEFDYSSDKVSGFMLNKKTDEYYAFMLDPKNIEENREHLWKQLQQLFLKEGSD